MNLKDYIKTVHNGNQFWFVDEVSHFENQKRILDTIEKKKYLDGRHAISNRVVENYNGKPYEQRAILLQYAKLIVNLETTYLLKKPVTFTGEEKIVGDMKRVYKKGKYDKINFDLLSNLVKYGNAYEYVYINGVGDVSSKVIPTECGYPIYNDELDMIAFVEYYTSLESDFYVVYTQEEVVKYSTIGGTDLRVVGSYNNVSGLPIHYKTDNELSMAFGKSDLDDFINIIDAMEDLLSKFSDSFYKHHNPIPVVIGQQLKGEGLNPHIVGGGITLDDNADFKMVSNSINHQAFEVIFNTLMQQLINIASVPAVALNASDVSNLSEMSMRMLYQLADMKGGINERHLREGLEQRNDKVVGLLGKQGKAYSDDAIDTLDMVFHYARPVNETEVIDNLVKMYQVGAISIESLVEISPYVSNERLELKRILEREQRVSEQKQVNEKVNEHEQVQAKTKDAKADVATKQEDVVEG
ncbi:phage portal protein [Bacillus mycoides]|uniref:phage portal protein n=1 Tax=Bacillus mycoides TaxID=1405 RepID=UPI001C026708|nr:phage portal protein [Bacillus mycoides]QWG55363.1 phage portal protein [Bacillus mycoides]